jgi:hypothetical protein
MFMVAVSGCKRCKAEDGGGESHLGAIGTNWRGTGNKTMLEKGGRARLKVNTNRHNPHVSIIFQLDSLPLGKELQLPKLVRSLLCPSQRLSQDS